MTSGHGHTEVNAVNNHWLLMLSVGSMGCEAQGAPIASLLSI